MSEFDIIIGLKPDANFEKFQKQILDLYNELGKPIQIKVDSSQLENLQKDFKNIAGLVSEINNTSLNVGSPGIIGGSSFQKEVKAVKSSIGAIKAETLTNVNSIEAALKKIDKIKLDISADGIDKIVKSFTDAEVQLTNVEARVRSTKKTGDKVISLIINGRDELGNTISYLVNFNKKTGEIASTITDIKTKFDEVGASVKNSTKEYNNAKSAMKNYYSALVKWKTNVSLSSDITEDDGVYKSKSGTNALFANNLNDLKTKYSKAMQSTKEFSNEAKQSLDSLEASWKNAASAAETQRIAVEKQKESIEQSTTKVKEATNAVNAYYNAQIKLSKNKTAGSDVKLSDESGKWESKSGSYTKLAEELNRLKAAYNNAVIDAKEFSQANQDAFNEMQTAKVRELSLALEEAAAKEKATGESTVVTNFEKRSRVVNQYYTALKRLKTALSKYTAAENSINSASRTAYSQIKEQVSILENRKSAVEKILTAESVSSEEMENVASLASNANSVLKEQTSILEDNGKAHQSLTDKVGGLVAKFSSWLTISQMVMYAVNSVKKMITASIELDSAMTELKKVTNETDSTYSKFLDNASARTAKLGASLSDVVTATADFAKLGYDISEAEGLADAAIVYKNVGDNIEDISDASESIIATMQAFETEDTDVSNYAMSIVDKFNEVGNNFAIGSDGIGEALLRSAAAMSAAGNTLDETIALTTAANTVVQDPESVGEFAPNNTVTY